MDGFSSFSNQWLYLLAQYTVARPPEAYTKPIFVTLVPFKSFVRNRIVP
jgi:hypothetical protein